MNRSHNKRRWLLVLLFLGGMAVALAGCGPELIPEATLEPTAEVAQLQAPAATPTSTPGQFQSPIRTPGPTNTFPPPPTVTPEPPTPTIPPVLTPRPTPVVTRIPTAAPPIIPLPPREPEPYTIVYREGSVVRAVDSDGRNDRVVIDIPTQMSRFLVDRSFLVGTWASPAPNGSQLALVVSNVENHDALSRGEQPEFDIYLLDLTTGEVQLLAEDGVKPVWSPDGSRIAYRSTFTQGMWIVDVATGHGYEAFSVGYPETEYQADWFTWSPDGRRIAVVKDWSGFANSGGVWLVNAVGGGEAVEIVAMEMNASNLAWSPTGDRILFLSSVGEHITPETPENLWIVEVGNGDQRQLTSNIGVYGGQPIWLSEGDTIIFSGANLLEGGTNPYDIWMIDSSGNRISRLTSDADVDLDPSLLPDDIRILFLKQDNGIWEINLVDGSQRKVTQQRDSYVITRHP
ncbi:MAG: PD40 domain-containing protein [Anaerolineae bacterium]|nr:PD40 domain-containing protein [Anaerolineae bacterium]MCB9133037.1 PD40 domain-containing protein [Anaerolineales bacterium]MCB0227660.1 PD40 domain-containing protein [Anaerolineae bacterium]MCB0235443.1 PD40 domain-containing protein [Anaerolineae bacterium]MCB0237415.1 PD40 domain-containing protein [Anaerolineae bacterium]